MLKLWEKRMAAAQNEMLTRHYHEVQSIYSNMRGWRHDYHNHLQTIKGHLALNQLDELRSYLDKIEHDLDAVDTLLKTGNPVADAILNGKITLARSHDIHINAKASVPITLSISDIDLCVILGNLLDNADESCQRLPDASKRFIRLYIDVLKQNLYISITNSVGIEPKKFGLEFFTTKDKEHGFGIRRIDSAVAKYGGYINRQHEPGVFATEIMLPL